jgi:hypothetical protein
MTIPKNRKLPLITNFLCGVIISGLCTPSVAQDQIISTEPAVEHPGWVHIPGAVVRPDCVHEIPNGATVEVKNGQITGNVALKGRLIAHYDGCPEDPVITRPWGIAEKLGSAPGTGNGWIEDSQWHAPLNSTDNIDYLAGTWIVPSNPAANGALIFLFNAIEPSDQSWILQPVLQYGTSAAGGGNYWAIASWLVSNSYTFHSPLAAVRSGEVISGYTKMTSRSGSTLYWKVQANDTRTGGASWITAYTSGYHLTWAFSGVLEAYNVTSCNQLPKNDEAVFSNSVVAHGFPSYSTISPPGRYGVIRNLPWGGPSCDFNVLAGRQSILSF